MTAYTKKHDVRNVDGSDSDTASIKANRTARFWDRMADRYAAKPVANEDVYARKLAITREYLHPEAEVLELGCGTGSTALAHAPCVKHIRATDVSSRMIGIARDKASVAGICNVEFACSAVNNVHAQEASLDAVFMLNLLHLLNDWQNSINRASHILKPGGVLVSSTLCLDDGGFALMRILARGGGLVRLLPRLSFFTRTELEQTMIQAGFQIAHTWQPAAKSGVFIVAKRPL